MSILRRAVGAALLCAASTASAQTSFTYSTRGCFGASCTVSGASAVQSSYTQSAGTVYFNGRDGLTVGPTNANGYIALTDLGRFTFATGWVSNGNTVTIGGYNNPLTFKLWIDFTAPQVIGDPVTFSAALSGTLYENSTNGTLNVNFDPNSTALTYATGAGSQPFRLFVDDRSTSTTAQNYSYSSYNYSTNQSGDWTQGTSTLTLTGAIDCSPAQDDGKWKATPSSGGSCGEPSTVVKLDVPQSAVPEPSTYALMAAGLAGVGVAARRRRRRRTA
jgi:hypothetical protein